MAELPEYIRKPGGDLVPTRGPFSRKVLLPAEADLCNILGITKEEYFQFLEDVAAKIKERPEAYKLVPDIVNMPALVPLVWTGTGLTWFGTILVSVAINVVAYLLTDRPDPSSRTARRTADIAGLKRFAPQFGFNSVQDLAFLGDVIPLVFADLNEQDGIGGVRVNSQLLWSQIVSLGRYQQLKILGMFSLGELAEKPRREGYAIGDLLLKNYNEEKILLKENNIPFVTKGSGTNKEKFTIDGNEWFSGTRNPTTQAVFGLTSPVPNATYFRLPYELHRHKRSGDWDDDNAERPAARFKLAQRRKNLGKWPARAGVIGIRKNEEQYVAGMDIPSGKNIGDYIYPESAALTGGQIVNIKKGEFDIPVGTFIEYQIVGKGEVGDNRAYQQNLTKETDRNDPGYMKFGVQDVDAISKTMRETTDNILSQSEQYMIGTTLVRCISGSNDPFILGEHDKVYAFRVLEKGRIECVPNHTFTDHVYNPIWIGRSKEETPDATGARRFKLASNTFGNYFYYGQRGTDLYNPATTYTVQKAVIGTVSDNRKCDITEIGIKSKVFKQMNFANVNSKPTEADLYEIIKETSFALGNVSKYIKRYSFFKLQIKEIASDTWETLIPENYSSIGHSGLFCVRGSSTETQYNYVRIEHPTGQYEYRFLPWPGADVIKTVERTKSIVVNLLNANNATDNQSISSFRDHNSNKIVKFAGNKNLTLNFFELCNSEWNLGSGELDDDGNPIDFSSTQNIGTTGIIPIGFTPDSVTQWGDDRAKYDEEMITKWTRFYAPQATSVEALTVPESGSYTYSTVTYPDNSLIVNGQNNTSLILISQAANGRYNVNCYLNPNHTPPNVEGYGTHWMQGWFNNMQIDNVTHVQMSSAFGGGETVLGVEFEYTVPNSGSQKGKLIPIRDPNIPGAGSNGHPGGNTNFYYVRNIETDETPTTPVINQTVALQNVDATSTHSGAEANLTIWKNSVGQVYAEWEFNRNPSGTMTSYEGGRDVIVPAQTIDGVQIFPGYRVTLFLGTTGFETNVFGEVDPVIKVDKIIVDSTHLNPYDAASDYWLFNGDRSSHLEGPEHEIVYCNEIIKDTSSTYNDLAYAALSVDSSKEWSNFSQFSAYIKKGIKVERLIGDDGNDAVANTGSVDSEGKGPTHLFPEIAHALLTDEMLGAGAVINANSVNKADMTIAAKFCKANGFFWDGVISNKVNLREFIFEQATYCFLDFTIIGGVFSLKPSVPYNTSDYTMNQNKDIEISAMFNDGNMNELNVAFLSAEERQTFKAVVLYRDEKENGFPETKSVTVQLDGDSYKDDPVQTFDLSGFCCSEQHAIAFGRYVLSVKLKTSHMITFKTSPNYIQQLKAGDYIRVYSTTQHTDRFRNGAILAGGKVVSKDEITGSQNIYWWNSTKEAVEYQAGVDFDSSSALAAYAGSLFTIVENEASDQCYRVESLTFSEDSLIEIAASNVELDGKKLAILQEWNVADDGSHRFV